MTKRTCEPTSHYFQIWEGGKADVVTFLPKMLQVLCYGFRVNFIHSFMKKCSDYHPWCAPCQTKKKKKKEKEEEGEKIVAALQVVIIYQVGTNTTS